MFNIFKNKEKVTETINLSSTEIYKIKESISVTESVNALIKEIVGRTPSNCIYLSMNDYEWFCRSLDFSIVNNVDVYYAGGFCGGITYNSIFGTFNICFDRSLTDGDIKYHTLLRYEFSK